MFVPKSNSILPASNNHKIAGKEDFKHYMRYPIHPLSKPYLCFI